MSGLVEKLRVGKSYPHSYKCEGNKCVASLTLQPSETPDHRFGLADQVRNKMLSIIRGWAKVDIPDSPNEDQ